MKKFYTLFLLLSVVIINAQNPLVVKDVTSSLKPTGNSNKADLNYAKWNGKYFTLVLEVICFALPMGQQQEQ